MISFSDLCASLASFEKQLGNEQKKGMARRTTVFFTTGYRCYEVEEEKIEQFKISVVVEEQVSAKYSIPFYAQI